MVSPRTVPTWGNSAILANHGIGTLEDCLCCERSCVTIDWLESIANAVVLLSCFVLSFVFASFIVIVCATDERRELTNMCFLAGNNYAIMNESSTHPAKIFFAQGCEISSQFEDLGRESQSWSRGSFDVFGWGLWMGLAFFDGRGVDLPSFFFRIMTCFWAWDGVFGWEGS